LWLTFYLFKIIHLKNNYGNYLLVNNFKLIKSLLRSSNICVPGKHISFPRWWQILNYQLCKFCRGNTPTMSHTYTHIGFARPQFCTIWTTVALLLTRRLHWIVPSIAIEEEMPRICHSRRSSAFCRWAWPAPLNLLFIY